MAEASIASLLPAIGITFSLLLLLRTYPSPFIPSLVPPPVLDAYYYDMYLRPESRPIVGWDNSTNTTAITI